MAFVDIGFKNVVLILLYLFITNRYWNHKYGGLIIPLSSVAAVGASEYLKDD